MKSARDQASISNDPRSAYLPILPATKCATATPTQVNASNTRKIPYTKHGSIAISGDSKTPQSAVCSQEISQQSCLRLFMSFATARENTTQPYVHRVCRVDYVSIVVSLQY